jgi:hypothetical protein
VPDWYELAAEQAVDNHDPADYEGRGWDQLTDAERNEIIIEYVLSLGDA